MIRSRWLARGSSVIWPCKACPSKKLSTRTLRKWAQIDRVLAGLAAAYSAYRLWTGARDGIVYGDGDRKVQADTHPAAYVLTMLSLMLLVGLLGYIAIGADMGLANFLAGSIGYRCRRDPVAQQLWTLRLIARSARCDEVSKPVRPTPYQWNFMVHVKASCAAAVLAPVAVAL
jgi:hypothetical protein